MGPETLVFYWFLVFYGPNGEAGLYGPYKDMQECESTRLFGSTEPEHLKRLSGCFPADEDTLWWPVTEGQGSIYKENSRTASGPAEEPADE